MKDFLKKQNNKYLIIPVLVLAGVFAFIVGTTTYSTCYQTSDNAYVEGKLFSINPKIEGFVTHVYVQDNQEVSKGDLLLEIDPSDYYLKLQKAEKELRETKTKLSLIEHDLNESQQQDSSNPFGKNNFTSYEKMYGDGIVSAPKQEKAQPETKANTNPFDFYLFNT